MPVSVKKVAGYKVVHTSFPGFFWVLPSQPVWGCLPTPGSLTVHSRQDLGIRRFGQGWSMFPNLLPSSKSASTLEPTKFGRATPRPGRPLAAACGSYGGRRAGEGKGEEEGGGGAGRGGEEKLRWEVWKVGKWLLRASPPSARV